MCFYLFPLASRKFERVGMYNPTTHKLTIERANVDVLGKEYVRDRTLVREYNEKHNLSVSYTIWTLSALGMVYALGLFFINNLYKNVRCIKMTSPVINNIIIFGCILCYIATILYGMDSRHIAVQKIGAMCNIVVVMLSVGFTCAFGALFAKTWRIFMIFSSTRHNKNMAGLFG
ncbi:gamma-aminobutyric acid type B receptor subunit 2-like isoform X2 [Hydractinia symbiolongicarpus]|uniref:gamma-aminobutyric acid type B receptor subunit 2-like isoform X2 n=1 Tax=Hydractinia symbiolongicarpus TaxID=13093 RepID=UPI00254EBFD1|nr:gamma-aminobutyric acid type B receptor subunit 2-like isoform X2 [Hydractinia symbiolongicarpus]